MGDEDWTEHSITFLEMAFRTDRRKRLQHPGGRGFQKGACGDSVEIFIRIRAGRIQEVTYDMNGCMNTNACANAVAELAVGRVVEDAWAVTPEDVVSFLQSLPPGHLHCAELVVGAFYRALADYGRQSGKSWKSHYQERS